MSAHSSLKIFKTILTWSVNTKHGIRKRPDAFHVPRQGYIFKARKKSGAQHMSYHAVWAAVTKCAKSLDTKYPQNGSKTTTMLGESVPIHLSMKIARHADGSLQLHLDYARHANADVHNHFASRAGNEVKLSTAQATGPEGATLENLIQWHGMRMAIRQLQNSWWQNVSCLVVSTSKFEIFLRNPIRCVQLSRIRAMSRART